MLAGDAFLDSALTSDEGLNMDLVYMAADQYHQCIILARFSSLAPNLHVQQAGSTRLSG